MGVFSGTGEWVQDQLSRADVAMLEELEREAAHLEMWTDRAYGLGLLDEAELLDEAATEARARLEDALVEITEEGGDLDVDGLDAEADVFESLSQLYHRYLHGEAHDVVSGNRRWAIRLARDVLRGGYGADGAPAAFKRVPDSMVWAALKDAHAAREKFWKAFARAAKAEGAEPNPGWVTDEAAWERAKAIVEPRWDRYDEPYALVAFIYKKIVAKKERERVHAVRVRAAKKAARTRRKNRRAGVR